VRKGRQGDGYKVIKMMRGQDGLKWGRGPGPLAREGRLYLDICAPSTPRVPSYATADGAGQPTNPGPV